ncbi:lamin tail domain-containing protein [Streptomyces sp. SID2955]|nr:lamin tail domain-containing protein [Streptomyces sp. SID2955]
MSVFVSSSVTRRRIAATLVAAATAAVGAAALPASAADRGHDHGHGHYDRSQVVISGVRHHTSARYDRSDAALNKEWVQVSNNSHRPVNLDGWTLSDEDGHTYTFRHYRLGADQSVRVHTGVGRDRKNDVYQDRHESVWDSAHDTATLRNDHGRFIDATSWGYDHRGHRDGGQHRDHRDGGQHGSHRDSGQHRDHRDGGRHGGRH